MEIWEGFQAFDQGIKDPRLRGGQRHEPSRGHGSAPDPGTKKGTEVPYVVSQKRVRTQGAHDGVELPRKSLP